MQKKVKKISDYIGFRYFLLIVLALTGLVQFLFMQSNMQEHTYKVEELQLAPETIRSPKTIVDEGKTEQDRLAAAEQVEPVYETLRGWAKPTVGVTKHEDLPAKALAFIARIEALLEVPVHIISTGPDRAETITLRHPFSV